MRISTEQLPQHLAGGLRPLYTVFGAEPLLALESADRIRAVARAQGHTEREVLVAEPGFHWSELALAASAQSLFATRRILEVRVPGGRPGNEGAAALQKLCERPPPDTVTLVQLPDVDWRAQKAAWFEALESAGVTVEARVVTRAALPRWLSRRLKAQGQQAEPHTLDFIAECVEGNLLAAYQEVQKLGLLYRPGTLTDEEVRAAVLDVARYDVFALGRAMIEADAARFKRMLDGLKAEGTAPPLVLWVLAEATRALGRTMAGAASGRPWMQLMRDARIRDAAHQQAMQRSCAHHTPTDVAEALRHAARVDRLIKGLEPGDVWHELLRLGLRFAGHGNRGDTSAGRSRQRA